MVDMLFLFLCVCVFKFFFIFYIYFFSCLLFILKEQEVFLFKNEAMLIKPDSQSVEMNSDIQKERPC